ncbi:MAG TPA: YggT family protein [Steroidobacteraceae bacterium]|jgi:YggT family protein
MTSALHFLADTLLTLYLYVLILRFVMQLTRADFRNPLAHAVLVVTNPIIMPLRRIFPPVGKVDSASVLAIILVAAITVGVLTFIVSGALLDPINWLVATALMLVRAFIVFFMGAIFIYALLSWVVPAGYNPAMALLATIVEPVLRPFRRLIPPIGALDLSALWALLALGVLLRLLHLA